MKIHEAVRLIRTSKGIKQNYVAEQLGMSYQTYNHYEVGRRRLRAETLKEIADILDEPIENFFDNKIYDTKNESTTA